MGASRPSVQDVTRQQMLTLLPRLRRFAAGLTGSTADGDDLVQATYERAMLKIDTWEVGSRLDSWMFRIARNLFLNDIRSRKVRSRYADTLQTQGEPILDGKQALETQMLLGVVWQLINRLPEEQRASLLLVAVEGLSYAEAAEVLDLPIGTVTSRVARARTALKKFLDATDGPLQFD